MKQYGLVLADNGSSWYFQGTSEPGWPSGLLDQLKQIPASAFEAVDTSSMKVSPNSWSGRLTVAVSWTYNCTGGERFRLRMSLQGKRVEDRGTDLENHVPQ